jgi:hypothetical protein
MDSLINGLKKFQINKDETEFDKLISEFTILDTDSAEEEWLILKLNYSKLKYLNNLIDTYEFPETKKFISVLKKILKGIDSMNQYYLCEINWERDNNETIKEECIQVKTLFEQSLNIYYPIEKLKMILSAYDIFIPIIEKFRQETFVEIIDDQKFLEQTDSLLKKRKF